ncbi:uncharacterized protein LOC124167334 [Ischnura elegans]|uniref:uncharacterized protein LOC124167334 n=1 Tax=Ischnura elegans TaxID=197161 RepID=UPI001ED8B163|nr:uncharacterized protein LOC124167334 [Ischnura elegans]
MLRLKSFTLGIIFLCSCAMMYVAFFGENEYTMENKSLGVNPVEDKFIFEGPAVKMDDPFLIDGIRKHFLVPPADSSIPYALQKPNIKDTSMGQAAKIREVLKNMTNGFFVEAGALDGETRSNTLYMEKELGWKGLLVEADPLNFAQLITRNRRAWSTPICLSTKPHPMKVSFKQQANVGKISNHEVGASIPGHVDVQCLPLYSLLLALNVSTVHYFSLDVEGFELEVLQTIPFDKVDIQTLSVEFFHGQMNKNDQRKWMEEKGYRVYAEVTHPQNLANDFIFVKKTLFPE